MEKLDQALHHIALKRNALFALQYDDPKYDDSEEELHDLEDEFMEHFGDQLEDILQKVHDQYCPDTDVLLPIAYLAKNYLINDAGECQVSGDEGIFVELEPDDRPAKLVLVPNPTRLILNLGNNQQQVVWKS